MQSISIPNATHPVAAQLAALNAQLDSCTVCATVARNYRHVPGGGCVDQPDVMFIFINPTVRNISAHADWIGPRFPFAGKPKLWQILAESGFVRADLPQDMLMLGPTPEMVEVLIAETQRQRLYLTNAVKCVDTGSNLPTAARVAAAWSFLQHEIALIRPKLIVTFGLIPFRQLTSMDIRLADQLWETQGGSCPFFPSQPIAGESYSVFPCYFPTGRGNPVAATKMLRALRQCLDAGSATHG